MQWCIGKGRRMTMLVAVNADLLVRSMNAASDEETRYYLQGVAVAPCACGGVELVATDGHILSVFRDEDGYTDAHGNGRPAPIVRLGKDDISLIRRAEKGLRFATHYVVVEGDCAGSTLTVIPAQSGTQAVEAKREATMGAYPAIVGKHFIDGSFPDYRRVLPRLDSLGPCRQLTFDPAVLAKLARVVERRKQTTAVSWAMAPKGDGPILVRAGDWDNWYGVMMPMRGDGAVAYPAWAGMGEAAKQESHRSVAIAGGGPVGPCPHWSSLQWRWALDASVVDMIRCDGNGG
jgi:hypothetical protein